MTRSSRDHSLRRASGGVAAFTCAFALASGVLAMRAQKAHA
jgi:hypothetical protein